MPPEVLPVVLAGALALVGYWYKASLDRRRELEQRLSKTKVEVYSKFFDLLEGILLTAKSGKPLNEAKVTKETMELVMALMAYGSDEVVLAFKKFRQSPRDRILFAAGVVILEMRRDLGHSQTELTCNDILSLFINDLEEAKQLMKSGVAST